MTSGTCLDCGKKNLKNIEMHKRYCKSSSMQHSEKQPLISPDPAGLQADISKLHTHDIKNNKAKIQKNTILVSPPTITPTGEPITSNAQNCDIKQEVVRQDEIHTPIKNNSTRLKFESFGRIKQIFTRKNKTHPIILKNPDPKFIPELSEQERIKKLLSDAPLWTGYKPTGLKTFLTKTFNPGKTFAPCVFVSESRQPKILYIPYEPEKNRLIIPEKGWYIPSQQSPPFFFHEDFSLELIHSPSLKDRFNLPAHMLISNYNKGVLEGTLKSGKELLEEIKKYKLVCWLLGGLALIALVALIATIYSYDSHYKALESNYRNLTIVVDKLR